MEKDKALYHILVIEDNPGDFVLIEDYLEEFMSAPGIGWAKSFKEAQLLLVAEQKKYSAVLLDLSLPDKSGEELIRQVMALESNCPVIVLTGYSGMEFSVKSLALGVADYLLKDDLNASILYKSIVYNVERRKTFIALEESERRYSDIFQLSPLPMFVYDIETLGFLDVNQSTVDHYGYSKEEFLTLTIRDIRPKEEIPKLEEALKLVQQLPHGYQGTFKHQKKNGSTFYADIRNNAVNFKGRLARLTLINDITERYNYIRTIEQQNARLRDIAWIQSHVIRVPLARMMGLIDILKNYDDTDFDRNEVLNAILCSAHELDTIIRDISNKTEKISLDRKTDEF